MPENPSRIAPAEIADLTAAFVGHVDKYLKASAAEGVADEEQAPVVRRARNLIAAAIREEGFRLAEGLERFGFDPKGVLSVIHDTEFVGGGAAAIVDAFKSVKVELQHAAIRLRQGLNPARDDATGDAGATVSGVVAEPKRDRMTMWNSLNPCQQFCLEHLCESGATSEYPQTQNEMCQASGTRRKSGCYSARHVAECMKGLSDNDLVQSKVGPKGGAFPTSEGWAVYGAATGSGPSAE